MDIFSCIMGRRCVRAFKDKEIPEQILYDVLEAARWAPSSGNLQTTRFLIVTDKEKKAAIARAALGQYFISHAPVVIIVCSEVETARKAYSERGAKLYAIQNAATAVQNIMLAAYDRGLATCWVGAFTEARLRKEFEIPDKVEIHAIVPIGYPAEWPRAPARIPLSDITYFKTWKKQKAGEEFWPLEESAPRIAEKALKTAKEYAKKAKKAARTVKHKLKRKK